MSKDSIIENLRDFGLSLKDALMIAPYIEEFSSSQSSTYRLFEPVILLLKVET